MKNMKGITLIALVITIVVLIILAGVAISLSLGENGIFNKAKYATEEYANEQAREEMEIAKTTNQIDSLVGGTRQENKEMHISYLSARTNTTTNSSDTNLVIDVKDYKKLTIATLNMATANYNRFFVYESSDDIGTEQTLIYEKWSERTGESGFFYNIEIDISAYDYIGFNLNSGRGDVVYIKDIVLK